MDIDEVWYGPDYSDRINLFPDCYQEYVVKMNEVLAISGVRPIKLVAPLLGMSKELILKILEYAYGIGPEQMHSGYTLPESKLNGISIVGGCHVKDCSDTCEHVESEGNVMSCHCECVFDRENKKQKARFVDEI
jgi:7-cyano-7-deazaguanine synthase in queuosine biosynthesis